MVVPIPAGPPVLIGGPPTISLMGLAIKLGMAGLLKGLEKLAKTRAFKRFMAAAKEAKRSAFKRMKPGFLKCTILRAEPVDIESGEVVVEQQDFELRLPLPLNWTRRYSSHPTRTGLCGYGWETPADSRLAFESEGTVLFYDGTTGTTLFPSLPDSGPVRELVDGAVLHRADGHFLAIFKSGPGLDLPIISVRWIGGRANTLSNASPTVVETAWPSAAMAGALREIVSNVGPRLEVVSHEGHIQKPPASTRRQTSHTDPLRIQ
jgi:hypothetical protein